MNNLKKYSHSIINFKARQLNKVFFYQHYKYSLTTMKNHDCPQCLWLSAISVMCLILPGCG